MKVRTLIVCLALLVPCLPAFALTVAEKVTPQWTKTDGITVDMAKRDDGTIGFTITRYLDKAPTYGDNELATRRAAYLKLRDPKGVALSTMVAGEAKSDSIVYWFALSPDVIGEAEFSLSEGPDYKDPAKRGLIIGGTEYDFDLNAFTAKLAVPDHP